MGAGTKESGGVSLVGVSLVETTMNGVAEMTHAPGGSGGWESFVVDLGGKEVVIILGTLRN